MTEPKPFRFLDPPKELRLQIYELNPITTRHLVLKDPAYQDPQSVWKGEQSEIKLVVRVPNVSILQTCRLIYDECKPVLIPLFDALRSEPVCFIVDATSLRTFAQFGGVADLVCQNVSNLARNGKNPTFVARQGSFVPQNAWPGMVQNGSHRSFLGNTCATWFTMSCKSSGLQEGLCSRKKTVPSMQTKSRNARP